MLTVDKRSRQQEEQATSNKQQATSNKRIENGKVDTN
jgi:hypothetical protein